MPSRKPQSIKPAYVVLAMILAGNVGMAANDQDLPTSLTLTDTTYANDALLIASSASRLPEVSDLNYLLWFSSPCLPTLNGLLEAEQQPERKQEAPQQPEAPVESEKSGGFRLGTLIPTAAQEEKLSAMFAGGLFYFTDFIDEKKKWRIELALDMALRDEGGVEDRLYLFRGGVAYRASEASATSPISSYVIGGIGYATERVDIGPGNDITSNAMLVNIGLMVRIKQFDIRLDYFAFAGSDNTTGAIYLTAGVWF